MPRLLTCTALVLLTTACGQAGTRPAAPAEGHVAAAAPPSETVTPGIAGTWPDPRPPVAATCTSSYPDGLRRSAHGFDATVTAVRVGDSGGTTDLRPATVELAVHEVFAGPARRSVVMRTWDAFLPQPDPQDAVGLRVLVSAGETLDLRLCGFSRPYDETDAAAWRAAFNGA